MKILSTAALAFAAMWAGQAQAANLLTDNFNAEGGGTTHIQYTGFANFNVVAPGGSGVDLVASPNIFGITCAGGSGSCVDLDGTPGPAALQTSSTYNFAAGDIVTLSFELSQDQRDRTANPISAGFVFSSPTDIAATSTGGAFGATPSAPGLLSDFLVDASVTDPTFNLYTISFTAAQSGSFIAEIGTSQTGNIGALLDNVSIDLLSSAAPEPASWLTMLVGFFGLGAMARLVRRGGLHSAV